MKWSRSNLKDEDGRTTIVKYMYGGDSQEMYDLLVSLNWTTTGKQIMKKYHGKTLDDVKNLYNDVKIIRTIKDGLEMMAEEEWVRLTELMEGKNENNSSST